MGIKETLDEITTNLSKKLNAYFTGIYLEEEPVSIYCINSEKEKSLKELIALLVRKTIMSANDLMDGFNTEFMFAEGKDYGIFIHVVGNNLSIVTVLDSKPNFSLIKFENEKVSKELSNKIEEIKSYLEGKEEKPSKVEQEVIEEESKTEEISEDVSELEKVLSEETEEIEKIEEVEGKEVEEEKRDIEEVEEAPSLEEILEGEQPVINTVSEDILEKIKKEFIKEIGPVGKVIFNKIQKKEFQSNITSKNLKVFADRLAAEISELDRKADFLKNVEKIISEGGK